MSNFDDKPIVDIIVLTMDNHDELLFTLKSITPVCSHLILSFIYQFLIVHLLLLMSTPFLLNIH